MSYNIIENDEIITHSLNEKGGHNIQLFLCKKHYDFVF